VITFFSALFEIPSSFQQTLVLPTDPEGTSFEGYVSLGATTAQQQQPASLWLRLTGVSPGSPTLAGSHLDLGTDLEALLKDHKALVQARLRESPSADLFLVELQSIVASLADSPQ
jgi:hypothetical protein